MYLLNLKAFVEASDDYEKHCSNTSGYGPINFFHKELNSKYFRLREAFRLGQNSLAPPSYHEGSHRQYINE